MDVFSRFAEAYGRTMSRRCCFGTICSGAAKTPSMRATAAERMVAAIGGAGVDTSRDQRLGRIFSIGPSSATRPSPISTAPKEIERVVGFFRHASQGLEERKQILTLLGLSVAASRRWRILKNPMEKEPTMSRRPGIDQPAV